VISRVIYKCDNVHDVQCHIGCSVVAAGRGILRHVAAKTMQRATYRLAVPRGAESSVNTACDVASFLSQQAARPIAVRARGQICIWSEKCLPI